MIWTAGLLGPEAAVSPAAWPRMKPTLVTGASGFLGWHVARLLVERGHRVRALVRPSSKIRELDVEAGAGDLRDAASVERAVAGCGLVFHVAADYRLWAADTTRTVSLQRGWHAQCVGGGPQRGRGAGGLHQHRGVHRSAARRGEGDEDCPVSLDDMKGAYKRSKFLAERTALEFAAAGLPVVIVNPTAPVGDHDIKPTPTGRIVLDFLKGDMPAFIDTGLNVVDARDVALGQLLACERGRAGERYILGSENLTLAQILEKLAAIAGRPAPTVQLPYAVAYAAGVVTTAWAR